MTKAYVLTTWTGWNHVADFDIPVRHYHPINKELHKLAFLLKARTRQASLDPLAELLH